MLSVIFSVRAHLAGKNVILPGLSRLTTYIRFNLDKWKTYL